MPITKVYKLQENNHLLHPLKWLMFFRLVVAILGIAGMLITRGGDVTFKGLIFGKAYYILVFACVVNIFYLIFINKIKDLKTMAILQLMIDIMLESVLAYLTGATDSIFSFLFFATIVSAAVLISGKVALFFASCVTIILSSIVSLYYFTNEFYNFTVPFVKPIFVEGFNQQLNFILPYLFFYGLSIHLVAFLAGRLASELRRAKIFTSEIVQNIGEPVISLDNQNSIVFMNSAAESLFGIEYNEMKIPLSKWSNSDFIQVNPNVVDIICGKRSKVIANVEVTSLKNEIRFFEFRNFILQGFGKDSNRGIIVIMVDETLKRKMEEIDKDSDKIEALNEMSSSMAHELKNPLASLNGAVQALQANKNLALNKSDKKMLNIILQVSNRINSIINSFFELSINKVVKKDKFNLSSLLTEIIAMLEMQMPPNASISKNFPDDLFIVGNRDQLYQMFLNVGINAIESATDRPFKLNVNTQLSKIGSSKNFVISNTESIDTNGIFIYFEDNGKGMNKEELERIFVPFYSTKLKGTGLGMPITGKIIKNHNGKIKVDSVENKGTTVSIWLPI